MTVTATPPATAPTEYIVAQTSPPDIVCPAWCNVPYDEHVAALNQLDGRCIHWSDDLGVGKVGIRIARTTYPARLFCSVSCPSH
jgi:hypothetical protein